MTSIDYLIGCVKRVFKYPYCLQDVFESDCKNRRRSSRYEYDNDKKESLETQIRKYIIPYIQSDIINNLSSTFENRLKTIDPNYAYQYSLGNVRPNSDIEEVELRYFINMNKDAMQTAEKATYENDDMQRIKHVLTTIPPKITAIDDFNSQLWYTINEFEQKAIKTIEVSYGNALQNANIDRQSYFKSFDAISTNFSSRINSVVATACEASVKKVTALINQKKDIIRRNNADKDKYNQLMQKLQQQYDDEFALQKIKEINSDVNLQMDNTDDIAQKEEGSIKIQSIMNDIEQLDTEVNERRMYEVQYGQIEI
ncbi:MAG: hypothetical protein IKS00_06380 [Bacteroidales bacterium]|nr:hypothetical protein [Bacteroidales bacterium]